MASRKTHPAPVGGWNTRDDLAQMPPTDAVVLDNWIPELSFLRPRKGYQPYRAVGTGAITALVPYYNKFLAACEQSGSFDNAIFELTAFGAGTPLGSNFASNHWDSTVFEGKAILVNGADNPQLYDGTSLEDADFTGANPSEFVGVHVFKNRVYYWPKQGLEFYYTELFAPAGIVTRFPLPASRGGTVVSVSSWTEDGGDGPDDYLCIITSEGEVIVYAGTDPGTDFAIVGRYIVGRPVGRDAVTQYLGKLMVVTEQDYLIFPDALRTQGVTVRTKLSGAARDAVAEHGNKNGWQAYYDPVEGFLLINVPTKVGESVQHIVNVRTDTATRFTGLNARCWARFNGRTYFGGYDGLVYVYAGSDDFGSDISTHAVTAPSMMGIDSEKTIPVYRLRLSGDGNVSLTTGLGFDFELPSSVNTVEIGGEVLPWGSAWGSEWPDTDFKRTEWLVGEGRGTFVSTDVKLSFRTQRIKWYTTDYMVNPGGGFR